MKKKTSPRQRLSKIAKAKSPREKFVLAHFNMTEAEWMAQEMMIAREFFDARDVQQAELIQRVKKEFSKSKNLTARTESEFLALKSLQKQLTNYTWTAMRLWKPEMLEKLARAMRRIQQHTFPHDFERFRYGALIACNGNVERAYLAVSSREKNSDPADVKRALYRIKRKLFPTDT